MLAILIVDQMVLCLLFQSSFIEIHRGIDLRGLCAVVLVSMSSREQPHFAKFRTQLVQMLDHHFSDQDGLLTTSVLIRRCWQFAVLDSMFSTLTLSRSIRTAWSPRPSSARRYLHFHLQFWIRCSMATFVLDAISHNRSGLFCG